MTGKMVTRWVKQRYATRIEHSDVDEPQEDSLILLGGDNVRWVEGRLGLAPKSLSYAQVLWIPLDPETNRVNWDKVDQITVCEDTIYQIRQQLSYPGEQQIGWIYVLTTDS